MATAGYSGTPLAKKLGISAGMRVLTLGAPPDYPQWLAPLPAGVQLIPVERPGAGAAFVHLFTTSAAELATLLPRLRKTLDDGGVVWVSWPKKAARVPTNVTEDTIRALALPLGYVDVKVCAVSAVWSGLKLVVRKEPRG